MEQVHNQDRFDSEFQERLIKNLSEELVKSTKSLFEVTLKTEIERTILPSIETLTRTTICQTVDQQISRCISEPVNQVRQLKKNF